MLCLPLPLERYIYADEFDPEILARYGIVKPMGKNATKKPRFLDCVCAFDIEATNIDAIQQAAMYIWQFQFETDLTIFGRSWDQFLTLLQRISRALPENTRLAVYVHNLSYEFQFLQGIYTFQPEDVFAINRRKVCRADMFGNIELRCSYIQTNKSLKVFTREMNVKHQKLSDYDYSIQRYPWSELTIEELRYCQNDVLGLCEAIRAEMLSDGDNLITIPLTSTGYVRRECKAAMKKINYNYAKPFFPSLDLFLLMRRAFRGGDTHGNRCYCSDADSDTILLNVHSYDRSSSYPDVMINCLYPVKPFKRVENLRPEDIPRLLKRGRALLMELRLTDVRLKNPRWGNPYISKDKSRDIVDGRFFNGRVLSATALTLAVTDVDLRIISETYEYNMEILTAYKSTYGRLPEPLLDVVRDYYIKKTTLKGKDDPLDKTLYMKSKNKLNSCYGMMATSPLRDVIEYSAEERDFLILAVPAAELLEKARRGYWLPYEWGIWTTAHARYRLYEGVKLASAGADRTGEEFSDFVYCDTDSVKYIGTVDWSAYNAARRADSLRNRAFADDANGKRHYMGVYEQEDDYTEFKTLGAKKYAGIINGKLEITIAGVDKKAGAAELAAAGGLPALRDGFTFRAGGGLTAYYNDKPEITEYRIGGHTVPITSNLYLCAGSYTVGSTEEYKRILLMSKQYFDKILHSLYNEGILKEDE